MANLEMAIQLAKSNKKPVNQVLFAFWGAEELGLLGSRHFVQRLTDDGAISDIALNLNYDMIVSWYVIIIDQRSTDVCLSLSIINAYG